MSEVSRDETLSKYADSRRTQRGAESYATKYDREFHKRVSSWFERRAIRRAVARTGASAARVLDVPCGAGRLTPLLSPAARELISADYSHTMVGVHRERHGLPGLVADGFHLPFAGRGFDLVFSARLAHHIADDTLRADYLREIMRVSDRWVVVTVFDTRSLKNRLRNLSRRFTHKRRKNTFTREQVAEIAAGAGYSIRAGIPLARLSSGHVFYVLERDAE